MTLETGRRNKNEGIKVAHLFPIVSEDEAGGII